MKVLVDTSIWSLALRRRESDLSKTEKNELQELNHLIDETRVKLIGPIRQEILSGILHENQFEKLKNRLRAFDDFPIERRDYELGAKYFNLCRKKGIQGSHIDFLVCSVAANNKINIFTKDKDFFLYQKILDIKLHSPRNS